LRLALLENGKIEIFLTIFSTDCCSTASFVD
jgi:hypothetical protein